MSLPVSVSWVSSTSRLRTVWDVSCGDSSTFAWRLITTPAEDVEQRVGTLRERWRFEHCEDQSTLGRPLLLTGSLGPRSAARSLFCPCHISANGQTCGAPSGGGKRRTAQKKSIPVHCADDRRRIVYRPESVPEVPFSLVDESRWNVAIQQPWELSEHTNVLGLRDAWSTTKKATRDPRFVERRMLLLHDNMVTVLVQEKGQSRVCSLNRLCQTAAAYILAASVDVRVRHVETDKSPADGPSRKQLTGWHTPAGASTPPGATHARQISLFNALFDKKSIRLAECLPPLGLRAAAVSDSVSALDRPPGLPPPPSPSRKHSPDQDKTVAFAGVFSGAEDMCQIDATCCR